MYTNIIYITLSYKCTLCKEVVYTNYFTNSLNIYIGKTPVSNSNTLSGYLSTDKKLYYNSSLSLNKSVDLTSISL